MANALTSVNFHGASLLVTTINGQPHVAVRPICDAIGVDWKAQYQRIHRHPVLSSTVVITTTTDAADGKNRSMVMLPIDRLNGWLFGLNADRVKPELRERVIQYQRECFDALASHFGLAFQTKAAPVPAPVATAPALPDLRTAMMDGLGHPAPLSREHQAMVNRHAWGLAHEAYELMREHIERMVAWRTTATMREQHGHTVARCIKEVTLDTALAHRQAEAVRSATEMMRVTVQVLSNAAKDVEQRLAPPTGAP